MSLFFDRTAKIRRRVFLQRGLQMGGGMLLASIANSWTSTSSQVTSPQQSQVKLPHSTQESPPQIKIGYWQVVSGLPLYLALAQGLFEQAGLDVQAIAFTSSRQIAEAMIDGKIDGFANGTTSGALALAEISRPSLFKIFATNPRLTGESIDKSIVLKHSSLQSISDLNGLRVGCDPGWQNLAIVTAMLKKSGITTPEVIQIEPSQQIKALRSGQIAAVYSLEPTGIDSNSDLIKTLEIGGFAKYLLDDSIDRWSGGSASLSSEFMQQYPLISRKYIDVYAQAIQTIRAQPIESLSYLKGYTSISSDLSEAILLSKYQLYNEFTSSDISSTQQFFDLLHRAQVLTSKVSFASLLHRG